MKKYPKFLPVYLFVFCLIAVSCSSESVTNEVDEINQYDMIDFKSALSNNVITINSEFSNTQLSWDENNVQILRSSSRGVNNIVYKYPKDNILKVKKNTGLFFEDNYVIEDQVNDINYIFKNIDVVDEHTFKFTQLHSDGYENEILVNVPFKLPNEIDEGYLIGDVQLRNEYIHSKLSAKCPPCVVLVVIAAVTLVGDSEERKDENCAENNRAVERNCMNRDDKCLENHGPCDLRCVSC